MNAKQNIEKIELMIDSIKSQSFKFNEAIEENKRINKLLAISNQTCAKYGIEVK